jgi:hypothetical protein
MTIDRSCKLIPASFKHLFWDCSFEQIRNKPEQPFVIKRILSEGTWEEIKWLRSTLGDAMIKQWIIDHRGKNLSLRQLRFWELILELPAKKVNSWISEKKNSSWHQRRSA